MILNCYRNMNVVKQHFVKLRHIVVYDNNDHMEGSMRLIRKNCKKKNRYDKHSSDGVLVQLRYTKNLLKL